MNFLKLEEYPNAIALAEKTLIERVGTIEILRLELKRLEHHLDAEIAFDEELKNDAQRKARKLQLLADSNYSDMESQLQTYLELRAFLESNVNKLKNEFTVFKLQLREKIAQLQARDETQ